VQGENQGKLGNTCTKRYFSGQFWRLLWKILLNAGIVAAMIQLNLQPCLPPFWAPSGHAQTVLGHLLPSKMLKQKGERIEISVSGGDKLVGFILSGTSNTVVYLFHGLAGSTDSTYMHRTAELALKLGHSVVMVNHRGCGEGVGFANEPYHSGRSEDLSAVLEYGRRRFPKLANTKSRPWARSMILIKFTPPRLPASKIAKTTMKLAQPRDCSRKLKLPLWC
jgi:hypothetical protein